MRQLACQVCYTRYHVSFYLWLIKAVLKHYKVPKYYDQDCLKIFFLLSTLPAMIQISGKKCSFGSKKLVMSKKLSISDGESPHKKISQILLLHSGIMVVLSNK